MNGTPDAVEARLADLARAHPARIEMGLARARRVAAAMKLKIGAPIITVGGTNGKGSVCAMLEAMLQAGGARTGCYTSPHLLRFAERIRINGAPAPQDILLRAFDAVAAARAGEGKNKDEQLTYFEFATLAAARCFAEANLDAVILEVGLGGRLDAVNIFDADAAVVTNVDIDHEEYLGRGREKIGAEKAGIFRRGRAAVVGEESPPQSLVKKSEQAGAPLRILGRDYFVENARAGGGWNWRGQNRALANLPLPAMRGAHQTKNAACALAALECLPDALWPGAGAVRRGLHEAALPGRFQVLPGAPVVVADVAHNPASARALEESLFQMGYFPHTAVVLGITARKDTAGFVRALRRRAQSWHIFSPGAEGANSEEVARLAAAEGGVAKSYRNYGEAMGAARQEAGESGRIVVTGSFLTVAACLADYGDNRR